jgi:hypothetical protein
MLLLSEVLWRHRHSRLLHWLASHTNPAALRFPSSVTHNLTTALNQCSISELQYLLAILSASEYSQSAASTMRAADDYRYNLGKYHHKVSTENERAQSWFDRGLIWCYAFHHEESARCFERAIGEDAKCAMAYWGVSQYHRFMHVSRTRTQSLACIRPRSELQQAVGSL